MIILLFEYCGEIIFVSIAGNDIRFGNSLYGPQTTPIEGLRLSFDGVCKEFPDLAEDKNWKEEACRRFNIKIKSLKNEDARADWIIEDLSKYGYILKSRQKEGFRPVKL